MRQITKNIIFCLVCGGAVALLAGLSSQTSPPMAQAIACTCQDCAAGSCDAACAASCCGGEAASIASYCKIDLNTATKEQLCTLSGIGEQKANLIIEYRVLVAPFATVEDVAKVTGITVDMVQAWGEQVYVSPVQE